MTSRPLVEARQQGYRGFDGIIVSLPAQQPAGGGAFLANRDVTAPIAMPETVKTAITLRAEIYLGPWSRDSIR